MYASTNVQGDLIWVQYQEQWGKQFKTQYQHKEELNNHQFNLQLQPSAKDWAKCFQITHSREGLQINQRLDHKCNHQCHHKAVKAAFINQCQAKFHHKVVKETCLFQKAIKVLTLITDLIQDYKAI